MNNNIIEQSFIDHKLVLENTQRILSNKLLEVTKVINDAILSGNKVLIFGNGGSAADAQHIAAEFTGRFVKERKALPAISLATDTSALTAIGNDYGFDKIFERQVNALAISGDVLIGISTSGTSPNVLNAFETGKNIGCINIGFSGRDGGKMNELCHYNLVVPSDITARIQEMHILIGHIICSSLDNLF